MVGGIVILDKGMFFLGGDIGVEIWMGRGNGFVNIMGGGEGGFRVEDKVLRWNNK